MRFELWTARGFPSKLLHPPSSLLLRYHNILIGMSGKIHQQSPRSLWMWTGCAFFWTLEAGSFKGWVGTKGWVGVSVGVYGPRERERAEKEKTLSTGRHSGGRFWPLVEYY